jgi:GNAT superfamily N-acetyltransferase
LGIKQLDRIWIAVDEQHNILGTSGLYTMTQDQEEAKWLSWYCVAPEARGQGVGKALLNYATRKAREYGAKYLRLYTGDDEAEKVAQGVYQRHGLKVYKIEPKLTYNRLYRAMAL